jgi:hypothetical protein
MGAVMVLPRYFGTTRQFLAPVTANRPKDDVNLGGRLPGCLAEC